MTAHAHAEAFRLMQYRSDDGTETEWVWNSRDGVTPFVISLRSGKQARHVDWQNDPYEPCRCPKVGDRVFIDLDRERAQMIASQYVDRWWDDPEMPMSQHPYFAGDKRAAVTKMAESYYEHGANPPDLVEVNETLRDRLFRESRSRGDREFA